MTQLSPQSIAESIVDGIYKYTSRDDMRTQLYKKIAAAIEQERAVKTTPRVLSENENKKNTIK